MITPSPWLRACFRKVTVLGWISAALPGGEPIQGVELLCVPVIDAEDGPLKPLFEVLADQRQDFEQLAATSAIDKLTIVEAQMREYHPKAGPGHEPGTRSQNR